MNGDNAAILMGIAAAAVFVLARIRIGQIRRSGQQELIRMYSASENALPDTVDSRGSAPGRNSEGGDDQ